MSYTIINGVVVPIKSNAEVAELKADNNDRH